MFCFEFGESILPIYFSPRGKSVAYHDEPKFNDRDMETSEDRKATFARGMNYMFCQNGKIILNSIY